MNGYEPLQGDGIIDEARLSVCTIIPYRGNLNSYKDFQSEIIAAKIVITNELNYTSRSIQVYFCDRENKIYIAEKEFNHAWKGIAQSIFQSMKMQSYRTGEPAPDYTAVEDRVDLSAYETESRKAVLEHGEIRLVGKPVSQEQKQFMMKRSSAMDNKKLVYAYSAADGNVHDKACPLVKEISNSDFRASEHLPEGRILCTYCRMMMVVRRGCGDDFKHYDWYKRFFRKGSIRVEAVEVLVDRYHARIRMEDPDTLWIKCGEEQWKLVLKEDKKVTLLHNNYTMISDTQRYISGGYHDQNPSNSLLMLHALRYIENYTWEGHLAAKAASGSGGEIQRAGLIDGAVEREAKADGKLSVSPWNRFKAWIEKWMHGKKDAS